MGPGNERNDALNNNAPFNEQERERKTGGIISEYIVEEKDKISDIARKHGLSIEEILAANPGLSEPADMVRPGMKICIPRKMT